MPLTAGEKLGPYEILAMIGKGGMGEVYRAHDPRTGRDVAVKVSAERFNERFDREVRAVAALNHPNICHLYDVGPNYLVMELVEGEEPKGPLPLETALGYARQIVAALEEAHDKGITHRDLKPGNIKITHDGTVKVLDFGLAKMTAPPEASSAPTENSPTLSMMATQAGVILGTAAYMPPEQAKGKPADRRADIWAFGVVFYELLTGKQLFQGETIGDILAAVIREEPNLKPLPAQVRGLISRCLQKDPKRRLQAIGEARLMLEDGAAEEAKVSRASMPILVWAAMGALAVALGALAWVHYRETPREDPVVRFQVLPPDKSNFAGYRLSPDGRFLAFVGVAAGNNHVMVRALDSLEPRVLPGTNGASLPFWAPDSTWIGYFVPTENKLKKVSVNGGPPQTLCDAPNRGGGTWNRDGTILFASAGGIHRVTSAGGVAAEVIKPVSGENHVFPEFLPDGRHFLYWNRAGKTDASGIYAGSLDGTPPVRLLPDAANAAFVPAATPGASGHLLFRREDTLMAQPFDPEKLKLTGELFPVAEQVGQSGGNGNGAFSVSRNGVLVYGTGGAAGNQELVWADRNGKPGEPVVPPGQYTGVRLSPDEKSIVFHRFEANNSDIWVRDLARGVINRLSFDPAEDNYPFWSFDGQRVVWPSRRSGNYDLYIKSAAGTGAEQLLIKMGTPAGWVTDWSRDGRFLMYTMPGDKTQRDLWVAPQNPGKPGAEEKPYPYLHEPYNEFDGVFSPDGRWVAYVSNESGRDEVYVQSFPLSGAKFSISQGGGTEPQWRKDGTELYYVSASRNLMAEPVKIGTTFVPGTPKALFPVLANANRQSYAATDGKRFLMLRQAGETAAAPLTVVMNWQAGVKK